MKFNLRLPNESDDLDSLHAFDFTKMSAVNTCPTWGIIRYGYHKVFSTTSRAMALEAGSACHEVFAAARAFDSLEYSNRAYPDIKQEDIRTLVEGRLVTMFGRERTSEFLQEVDSSEDERTRILRSGLSILNSGSFYDDPADKRRTMSNLEEACIAYLDRYEFGRNIPFIQDDYIGIETPINLIVEYETDGGIARTIRELYPEAYEADCQTKKGDRSKIGSFSYYIHPRKNLLTLLKALNMTLKLKVSLLTLKYLLMLHL